MNTQNEKTNKLQDTTDAPDTQLQEQSDPAKEHAEPESSCSVYPTVPGINCEYFQLPDRGLNVSERERALRQLYEYLSSQKKNFLGYQANQELDYEDNLKQYLDYHVNNIGDAFGSGNFTVNSKWIERAVLDYYARLWRAKWPHKPDDPESYWGYVLSMGSTEGNLYGLWNGRDYLAGKFLMVDPQAEEEARRASLSGRPRRIAHRLVYQQARAPQDNPNAYRPVVFYSEDTHYSIIKVLRVLAIPTFYEIGNEEYQGQNPLGGPWPHEVPSQGRGDGPGSIDIEALSKLVEFFASKGHPILICFNYGTTFKGAYDDVKQAGEALIPILKKYGLYERKVWTDRERGLYSIRNGFWFHVDGALGAAYMPFIEKAYEEGRVRQQGPIFDFRLGFVHSISMSGHKWIGAPWPSGIYMTKVKYQLRPPSIPGVVGTPDTTFAGSRNGFSAMIFWDYLAKNSHKNQTDKAVRLENLAQYACDKLKALGQRIGQDLWVDRTPLSLTIRFKRASEKIIFKYSLSGDSLCVSGFTRDYSHIYIMDHVDEKLIDNLISELAQPGAFPDQPQQDCGIEPPSVESYFTEEIRTLFHVPITGRGFE